MRGLVEQQLAGLGGAWGVGSRRLSEVDGASVQEHEPLGAWRRAGRMCAAFVRPCTLCPFACGAPRAPWVARSWGRLRPPCARDEAVDNTSFIGDSVLRTRSTCYFGRNIHQMCLLLTILLRDLGQLRASSVSLGALPGETWSNLGFISTELDQPWGDFCELRPISAEACRDLARLRHAGLTSTDQNLKLPRSG